MKKDNVENLSCDVPTLWLTHKVALRSFILKRVKEPELTDDILQEVLLKVYNFCMSKSGVKNVKSWLFQIANNTIIDHYRKQSKFSEKEVPDIAFEDENLAFKEALEYIQPLLTFLPQKYAVPLKLSDIDGFKQEVIAKQLKLSLSATKSRIQRARELLKSEFITCCHFEVSTSGRLLSFEVKDSCTPLQNIRKKILD